MPDTVYDMSNCLCCNPCDCEEYPCPSGFSEMPDDVDADMGTGWDNGDCTNCAIAFDSVSYDLNKSVGYAGEIPSGYISCCDWSYVGASNTLNCDGSLDSTGIVLFPAVNCATGEWVLFLFTAGNFFISDSLGMSPDFPSVIVSVSLSFHSFGLDVKCDGSGVDAITVTT